MQKIFSAHRISPNKMCCILNQWNTKSVCKYFLCTLNQSADTFSAYWNSPKKYFLCILNQYTDTFSAYWISLHADTFVEYWISLSSFLFALNQYSKDFLCTLNQEWKWRKFRKQVLKWTKVSFKRLSNEICSGIFWPAWMNLYWFLIFWRDPLILYSHF